MKFPLSVLVLLVVGLLVPIPALRGAGVFQEPASGPYYIATTVAAGQTTAQATTPVTVTTAEAVKPGVPPLPVPPSETFSWQLAFAVISNEIMRRLKASSSVTWVKNGAGKINVLVSMGLAAATSLGIHTEFDAVAGTFVATGLTLTSIAHFGGEFIRQYAFQQFTYQASKGAGTPA